MEFLIIGLGAAAFAAIMSLKRQGCDATVIDEKGYLLHSCGLPYALEGKLPFSGLRHEMPNVIKAKALEIDRKRKTVKCSDGKEYGYDRLLLSPGATPRVPKGFNKAFTVSTFEDTERLSKAKGETAAVIGAGAIGLEVAFALRQKGLSVDVYEAMEHCLPRSLDKDMAEIVQKSLDMDFHFNTRPESLGQDIIVSAIGVEPRIELAEKAGLKCGRGIVVDNQMRTEDEDIYAAGDAVETPHFITKEPVMMQLATSAYRQGNVAGLAMAGQDAEYDGSLMTFVSVIGNLEVASCGLVSDGGSIIGKFASSSKPEWMPSPGKVTVKVIADKDGRIVGGQCIGPGSAERVNMISMAIKQGMTLHQLSNIEMAYCPAVSNVYDPLIGACDLAIRRMKR